jgi:hypothetical protein
LEKHPKRKDYRGYSPHISNAVIILHVSTSRNSFFMAKDNSYFGDLKITLFIPHQVFPLIYEDSAAYSRLAYSNLAYSKLAYSKLAYSKLAYSKL